MIENDFNFPNHVPCAGVINPLWIPPGFQRRKPGLGGKVLIAFLVEDGLWMRWPINAQNALGASQYWAKTVKLKQRIR